MKVLRQYLRYTNIVIWKRDRSFFASILDDEIKRRKKVEMKKIFQPYETNEPEGREATQ